MGEGLRACHGVWDTTNDFVPIAIDVGEKRHENLVITKSLGRKRLACIQDADEHHLESINIREVEITVRMPDPHD